MRQCPSCLAGIADNAAECPNCGHQFMSIADLGATLFVIFVLCVGIYTFMQLFG